MDIIRGILGIILLLGIAFVLSNNKKHINWRLVGGGLTIQIIFAFLILKGEYLRSIFAPLGWVKDFFYWVSGFFVVLLNFTTEGAQFVFGNLALSPGQNQPDVNTLLSRRYAEDSAGNGMGYGKSYGNKRS